MSRNLTIEQVSSEVGSIDSAMREMCDMYGLPSNKELFEAAFNQGERSRKELRDVSLPLARLCLDLHAQLQQEREARERLETALEWYAEESVYQQEHFEGEGMAYPVLIDGGHSARAALAAPHAQAEAGDGA